MSSRTQIEFIESVSGSYLVKVHSVYSNPVVLRSTVYRKTFHDSLDLKSQ